MLLASLTVLTRTIATSFDGAFGGKAARAFQKELDSFVPAKLAYSICISSQLPISFSLRESSLRLDDV